VRLSRSPFHLLHRASFPKTRRAHQGGGLIPEGPVPASDGGATRRATCVPAQELFWADPRGIQHPAAKKKAAGWTGPDFVGRRRPMGEEAGQGKDWGPAPIKLLSRTTPPPERGGGLGLEKSPARNLRRAPRIGSETPERMTRLKMRSGGTYPGVYPPGAI